MQRALSGLRYILVLIASICLLWVLSVTGEAKDVNVVYSASSSKPIIDRELDLTNPSDYNILRSAIASSLSAATTEWGNVLNEAEFSSAEELFAFFSGGRISAAESSKNLRFLNHDANSNSGAGGTGGSGHGSGMTIGMWSGGWTEVLVASLTNTHFSPNAYVIDSERMSVDFYFEYNGTMYECVIDAGEVEKAANLKRAFFEAFSSSSYVVYSYGLEEELKLITSVSSTKTTDWVPSYIIHPLLGVIPYEKFESDTYFKSTLWLSLVPETMLTSFLDEYAVDLTFESANSNGATEITIDVSDVLFLCDSEEIDSSEFKYFWLHPSYLSFVAQVECQKDVFVAWEDAPSGVMPTITYIDTAVGSNVAKGPSNLRQCMYPIAVVSNWSGIGNISGIYSRLSDIDGSSEELVPSRLSIFSKGELGERVDSSDYSFAYSNGLSYLKGTLSEHAAGSLSGTTSDSAFKPIESADYAYFFSMLDGNLYAADGNYAVDMAEYYASSSKTYKPIAGAYNAKDVSVAAQVAGSELFNHYTLASKLGGSAYYSVLLCSQPYFAGRYKGEFSTSSIGAGDFWAGALNVAVIPESYMECIKLKWVPSISNYKHSELGKHLELEVTYYVETGRTVSLSLENWESFDAVSTNQMAKYTSGGAQECALYYYNSLGEFNAHNNGKDLCMQFVGLDSGPAIVLSSDYYTKSGLLDWLQTSEATEFMASRIAYSGYTAASLYEYLASNGVKLNSQVVEGELDRLAAIEKELNADKAESIQSVIFSVISFVGIIVLVYSVVFVLAYFLDIFNTFANISILGIITFGGLKAVTNAKDLDGLPLDATQKKKYVTRNGVLVRFLIGSLLGVILFSSSHIYIWMMTVYYKLMELFGLS